MFLLNPAVSSEPRGSELTSPSVIFPKVVWTLVVRLAKESGIQYPLQTCTIGMEGSSDVAAARKVYRLKVFCSLESI